MLLLQTLQHFLGNVAGDDTGGLKGLDQGNQNSHTGSDIQHHFTGAQPGRADHLRQALDHGPRLGDIEVAHALIEVLTLRQGGHRSGAFLTGGLHS